MTAAPTTTTAPAGGASAARPAPRKGRSRAAGTKLASNLVNGSIALRSRSRDVAGNIGAGTNSVMRWCRAAGVGRDVTARDREWATRLDVMRSMNKALTEHVRDLDTTTDWDRGRPRG